MPTQTIEIDDKTAAALERRAKSRGQSVSDVIAELVATSDQDADRPVSAQVAELERRWQRFGEQNSIADSSGVVRWLETWGTSEFRPWSRR